MTALALFCASFTGVLIGIGLVYYRCAKSHHFYVKFQKGVEELIPHFRT